MPGFSKMTTFSYSYSMHTITITKSSHFCQTKTTLTCIYICNSTFTKSQSVGTVIVFIIHS